MCIRDRYKYLDEHIAQKKAIYERYKEGLKDLPVKMNPYIEDIMEPNFWLSCLLINKEAMCKQVRNDSGVLYICLLYTSIKKVYINSND